MAGVEESYVEPTPSQPQHHDEEEEEGSFDQPSPQEVGLEVEQAQVDSQESTINRHFPLGPLPSGWTSGPSLSSECSLEMRVLILDTSVLQWVTYDHGSLSCVCVACAQIGMAGVEESVAVEDSATGDDDQSTVGGLDCHA